MVVERVIIWPEFVALAQLRIPIWL